MAMKKVSQTRRGTRGKFPPRKNGCFGNLKIGGSKKKESV